MLVLEARGLSKTFLAPHKLWQRGEKIPAVRSLSLTIKRGQVLGIVGESGCGKSTLARLLAGALQPDAGQLLWSGKTRSELTRMQKAQLVQLMFQDPGAALHPRRLVVDALLEPLRCVRKLSHAASTGELEAMLELLHLPREILRSYPNELSGGQKQRVCLARGLLLKPSVLICDEPLTALDRITQSAVLDLFAQLRLQLGLSLVFISHDLTTVAQIADEIAVMYAGQWMEQGDTQKLMAQPEHPYTHYLLQSLPKFYRPSLASIPPFTESREAPTEACPLLGRCPFAGPECHDPAYGLQNKDGSGFQGCACVRRGLWRPL